MTNEELLKLLFENKDNEYKIFNDRIVNTNMNTIGVRMPILKKIAKEILKGNYELFLNNVKDDYYEQIMVEGLVITGIKDYDVLIKKLDSFISKIDNWATCDMLISNAKIINKNLDNTFSYIKENIKSNNPWKVRVCFVILLNYFVKENYLEDIFKMIDEDENDFYYVMMAKAWLISKCYIKYPKKTYEYLLKTRIDDITYNKAISKICDSYRVKMEDKKILKNMKKKSKNA